MLDGFYLAVGEAAAGAGGDLKLVAYGIFLAIVVAFLALDLGVFHRDAREVKMKEAVTWSIIWVATGLAFSGLVYLSYEHQWLGLGVDTRMYNPAAEEDASQPLIINGKVDGTTAAVQYLTGYVVEKSLAMDNIFVIAMVFGFFAIPNKYQHRVLFWGIIGALVMRGAMIFIGGELIMKYQWILIFFGLFLLITALKMALIKSETDPSHNIVVKMVKRIYPVAPFFDGQKFFTRRTQEPTYSPDPSSGLLVQDPAPPGTLAAKWFITPLFLALIMVEITDLVFAVDSIPAIFAITPDPFIVFTSNIFAILGLRALYFCLAVLITKFRFLKPALILILGFVGVKLLLLALPPYLDAIGLAERKSVKVDPLVSLGVVVGMLAAATGLSIAFPVKPTRQLIVADQTVKPA
ncbi:MAG TPA: TerC family protein [Tepidisphaeraceae bacterium]|nr:TerC family protein [Tepidisphaeraceae bacterium]